jgi:hypothetical protein
VKNELKIKNYGFASGYGNLRSDCEAIRFAPVFSFSHGDAKSDEAILMEPILA